MPVSLTKVPLRRLFITGTLTAPTGDEQTNGWLNPSWSMWTLFDSREGAGPAETFDPSDWDMDDPESNPATWLAEMIDKTVGRIASADLDNLYAADSYTDQSHPGDMSLCAHPVGFTEDEISMALDILDFKYNKRPRHYNHYR